MNDLQTIERLAGWREIILSSLPDYHRSALRLFADTIAARLTYNRDGLATTHNADFMEDARFQIAYNSAVYKGLHVSDRIQWRLHTLCWAATHAMRLKGDFVECGVYRGFSSKVVIDYAQVYGRKFYLLDTYEGMVKSQAVGEEKNMGLDGQYEPTYEEVRKTFAPYSNVVIVKGRIPNTLKKVKSRKVAYLHIDMNCAAPEIAAIRYFWDKMEKGGIIVLDDYGFPKHTVQKEAMDKFAKSKGVQILTLPTGQGMLVKP